MIAAMTVLDAITNVILALIGAAGLVLVARINKQTKPNGGSSMRDTLDSMLVELKTVGKMLHRQGERLDDVHATSSATARTVDHHGTELEVIRRELDALRSQRTPR